MKLVLKVDRIAAHHSECGQRFARAVAELLRDGHSLVVIHGERPAFQACPATKTNGNGSHASYPEGAEFAPAERENRVLVSLLAKANVIGIGLRATDAGLVQLRKQHFVHGVAGIAMEAVRWHPRWLEIICSNKGVPVVSNLASWLGGEDHLIDSDQMAAVCAVDWNADALIYLTKENGVPAAQGGILRWFDVNSSNGSQVATLTDEMWKCLQACVMAVKQGVRRVRILPIPNVDCLSSFYFASIKYGTEVISARPFMDESMGPTQG